MRRNFVCLLGLSFWLALLPAAFGATFTSNTLIAPSEATYDGDDIVVTGCTLTVNGAHRFRSLTLQNQAVLTHSPASAGEADNQLNLTIDQDALVDATSRIDVAGKGYAGNAGPGAGGASGSYGSGGGHGGPGGQCYAGLAPGGTYDSIAEPAVWGSGGGSSGGRAGGAGGGLIRLVVGGTLTIHGAINANGASLGSGGAGGGISLRVGTLAGGGGISANGGAGATYCGAGGGGRVTIHCEQDAFAGTRTARGGNGSPAYTYGTAGTVLTKIGAQPGGLLAVDNGGLAALETPVTADEPWHLRVGGAAVARADGPLTLGRVELLPAGTLTHPAVGPALQLTVLGDVVIEADGALSADGRGYAGGTGPGQGPASGSYPGGGGYGGPGGASYATAERGGVYGSIPEPTDLGSGGGNPGGNPGGAGGGSIQLTVGGVLTVNGRLSADGVSRSSGGAGGSLNLRVGALAGHGVISANGGNASTYSGAGGGGRVAIYCPTDTFTGTVSAFGGLTSPSYGLGAAGTIFRKTPGDVPGELIVDNNGQSAAPIPLTLSEPWQVRVRNGATVYSTAAMVMAHLRLESGGKLTHPARGPAIDLTVNGDVLIDAGGAIDVVGKGFPASTGPGQGVAGSYSSGGGHGGLGGSSYAGLASGVVYGSLTDPTELGSGGGGSSGGAGGGAVRLVVSGTLTVNGVITAEGESRTAGGAGGSIYLRAGTLAGGGQISAKGGDAATYVGAGGGGRIAVYSGVDAFAGQKLAQGGRGNPSYCQASAGTIYARTPGAATGWVWVDNGPQGGFPSPLDLSEDMQVMVTNSSVVYLPQETTVASLVLASNSVLTHLEGGQPIRLRVTGDLVVDEGAQINADGKGFAAASGPGQGASGSYPSGGGYGGPGGVSWSSAPGGAAYGGVAEPAEFGSGGGLGGSGGGAGGGSVRLSVAGRLVVNGSVTAHGQNRTAGGSGGSLWLQAGALTGMGLIAANGGAGSTYCGSGGGGRVALYSDASGYAGQIMARGGAGWSSGGAGTVYRVAAGQSVGELTVENGAVSGSWTPLVLDRPYALRIANSAIVHFPAPTTVASLSLARAAVITHPAGGPGLDLTVLSDALIETGCAVDANGKGYGPSAGPGAGANGSYPTGAGYGGVGGGSWSTGVGGAVYGSETEPADFGSGGGSGGSAGSAGGGAVRLTVGGTLQVDGTMSANGAGGSGGGGAGGSLWISAGRFTGNGTVSAAGGGAGSYLGAGGGGRVAVYRDVDSFVGTRSVAGGGGWRNGAEGTFYVGSTVRPQVLGQQPSGAVLPPVDHVDVTFNTAIRAASFTAEDVVLTTPTGTVPSDQIAIVALEARRYRITFPVLTGRGECVLQLGPHIENFHGQEMEAAGGYRGTWLIEWLAVTGTVLDRFGLAVAGVTLRTDDAIIPRGLTDDSGRYTVYVPPGWSGGLIPELAGCRFDPAGRPLANVQTGLENQDFALTAGLEPRVAVSVSGADLALAWTSRVGLSYQLQASEDLVAWRDAGTPLAGTGGQLRLTLPTSGAPKQFYRVLVNRL